MGDSAFRSPHADDRDGFARLAAPVVDAVARYLAGRVDDPVDNAVPPPELRRELAALSLNDRAMPAEDIIRFLEQKVLPWSMPTNHPRSYAWINTSPAPIGVLGDVVATTLNNGLDGYDHSAIFMMHSLGRWLMELSGFAPQPEDAPDGMAILLSGGSAANLNGLTVARYRTAKRDGWDIRRDGLQGAHGRMIYYASAEAHSSVRRCIEQLGIGADNLRCVDTDDDFRMRPLALQSAIKADLAAGHRPACVVAAAGSTNVGVIDPLEALADICETHDLWLHVDGAYGGLGGLDPAYTAQYAAMTRAHSLTLDPHKWLQVPLDCGAILVRDRYLNHENYALVPDYLRAAPDDPDSVPWPTEHMFELTFADRALKTWATIARMGRHGVRDMIVNCNTLARLLGDLIERSDDMELLSPVSLSIVNFRYVPPGQGLSDEDLDRLNDDITEKIAASGEAHVPTTRVRGRVSIRVCFLHHDNCADDVYHLVELVRRFGTDR